MASSGTDCPRGGPETSHLLFDLDGTVVDPREGITRSIAYALDKLGRPTPTEQALTAYIGPPLGEVFRSLLCTRDPGLIQNAVAAYRERFSDMGIVENRVYPGIEEALASLAARGFRLSIATSKPRVYAERIVQHHNLARYFNGVFGPTLADIHESKGAVIRRVLQNASCAAAMAVMIGDRKEDVVGARENGINAIGVTWGYGTREELCDADVIVDTPHALISQLGAGRGAIDPQ
jgi:phosphoglycolate phosphatase